MNFDTRVCFIVLFLSCLMSCKETKGLDITTQLNLDEKLTLYPELKKAYDHYSSFGDDSLKHKAMVFLIENIDYKGGGNDTSNTIYCHEYRNSYCKYRETKSIQNINFKSINNDNIIVPDIELIKHDLLIDNVEYAFRAWDFPWSKNYSFDEFCEYILPYRISNEPISNWKRKAFLKVQPLIDSLLIEEITTPKEVCKRINNYVHHNFIWVENFPYPLISLFDLIDYPIGICNQRYLYTVTLCRSLGLPTAIDYVPQYFTFPGSHSCTTLTNDGNGEIISFDGGDEWKEFPVIGPKVYRRVFKKSSTFKEANYNLPDHLTNNSMIDVTFEYPQNVKTIYFPLSESNNNVKPYLYSFGISKELIAIAEGKIVGDSAVFENVMCPGNFILTVGNIIEDSINILQNPQVFFFNEEYDDIILTPNYDELREIKLTRKFPTSYKEASFFKNIISARVEGSYYEDFRETYLIDTIDIYVNGTWIKEFNREIIYPYYRYYQPSTNAIHLSELHFYFVNNDKSEFLVNDYYSMNETNLDFRHLFDMNISTNYNAENNWIGILNKNKLPLKRVEVLSRNSLNLIQRGQIYELWYFDKGWKLLEKRLSTEFELLFRNVPDNTLLLLRNKSTGVEERIFTFGGEFGQLFW